MKKQMKKRFTLIEVVIVIVILVTLASIAVPMYMNYISNANIGAAKTQIKAFKEALNGYKMEHGDYPAEDAGLQALIEDVEDKGDSWKKSLDASAIPRDPWGNEYVYRSPGDEDRPFEIISYGADGQAGGEGENADITSFDAN